MAVRNGLNRLLGGRKALRAEDHEAMEDEEDENAEGEDGDENAEGEDGEEKAMDDDEDESAEGEDDEKEASAFTRGRLAERKRVRGIVNSPEARGREALAQSLAMDTTMPASDARKVLGKAAKAGGGLAAAMANAPNPDVGPDGGAADRGAATPGRSLVDACQRRGAAMREKGSN